MSAPAAAAALALLAASALGCAHPPEDASRACKPGECPMHAEGRAVAGEPGHPPGAGAGPGPHAGEMRGAGMHAAVGMHPEHAARHAAIDRLVAIEDIQQLKARYVRCIDTRDLPCLRNSVFSADAEIAFQGGDYDIAVKGWPALEKFYREAFTPEKFGMHQVHTREIEVQGETATGIWYLHDVFVNLEQGTTLQGSALYRDDYVKRDGQWRIAKSTYQRLWEETTPRDPRTKLGSKPVRE